MNNPFSYLLNRSGPEPTDKNTSVNDTESESDTESETLSLDSQNSQVLQDASEGNDSNPGSTPEPTGAQGIDRDAVKTPDGGRRLRKGVIKRTPKKKVKREKPKAAEVLTAPGGAETEPQPQGVEPEGTEGDLDLRLPGDPPAANALQQAGGVVQVAEEHQAPQDDNMAAPTRAEYDNLLQQLQALQGQLAGDGDAAPRQARQLTVPEFSAPSEALSAELWLSNLRRQQQAVGAQDEQMLNAALCALKGTAGRWREQLELENADECNNFATFKTGFLKRFGKERSARDLLTLLKDLQQRATEPVRDFADRINLNIQTLAKAMQTKLPDMPNQNNRGHRNDGFLLAFNNMRSIYFCSGLRESLRTKVEPKFAETNDFQRLIEWACEFERTGKDKAAIAALQMENPDGLKKQLEDSRREIAALRAAAGQGGRKNPGQNNGGGGGQRGNGGGNQGDGQGRVRFAQKIAKVNKWKFCKKCQQWGKHAQSECRAPKARYEQLNPMDAEQMPSGQPVDWYFDEIAKQEN